MRIALLSFLLVACQNTPIFTTRCGVSYMGVWGTGKAADGWTQDRLQHFEDLYFAGQAQFSKDSRTYFEPVACEAMRGFEIWNHEVSGDYWISPWGPGHTYGLTNCFEHTVELSQNSPEHTAYAHEMVHVTQGCWAIQPIDKGLDSDHANWNRDGLNKGIIWASETMRADVADGGL